MARANAKTKSAAKKTQAVKAQARSKKTRSARRPLKPTPAPKKILGLPQGTVALGLLALVIGSGVQVAGQAHEVRRLHAELEAMGKEYNALLAESSRLTLERGARASYARVEKEAVEKLAMHFPEQIVTITQGAP